MKTLRYLFLVVFFLSGCSPNNGSSGQPALEKETAVAEAQAGTNTGAQAGMEESTSEGESLQVYFTSDIDRAEILTSVDKFYEEGDFIKEAINIPTKNLQKSLKE